MDLKFLLCAYVLIGTVHSLSIPCVPETAYTCNECISKFGTNATFINSNITSASVVSNYAQTSYGSTVQTFQQCSEKCASTPYCVGIMFIDENCIVYAGNGGTLYNMYPVISGYNITYMCQNYFANYNLILYTIDLNDTSSYITTPLSQTCDIYSTNNTCEYIYVNVYLTQIPKYQILPVVYITNSDVGYNVVQYESSIGKSGVIVAALFPFYVLFIFGIYIYTGGIMRRKALNRL